MNSKSRMEAPLSKRLSHLPCVRALMKSSCRVRLTIGVRWTIGKMGRSWMPLSFDELAELAQTLNIDFPFEREVVKRMSDTLSHPLADRINNLEAPQFVNRGVTIPDSAKSGAIQALADGKTHYTNRPGIIPSA